MSSGKSWCPSRALAEHYRGGGETILCKKWQNEE